MATTKKFEDLTTRRTIVLKNKHIAILTNKKINDLNKFVQDKIEELEPKKIDKVSQTLSELTPIKTDIEREIKLEDKIKQQQTRSIF